jgi:hypothetical protein
MLGQGSGDEVGQKVPVVQFSALQLLMCRLVFEGESSLARCLLSRSSRSLSPLILRRRIRASGIVSGSGYGSSAPAGSTGTHLRQRVAEHVTVGTA